MMDMQNNSGPEKHRKICKNCRYRSDEFTSVCVNADSPKCADFVCENDNCKWFEARRN
jgi:hypothetical protein